MPYGFNATSGSSVGTPGGYQSDCLPCLAGYYCLNATVTPFKCGKGYYTKLGQSVCQVVHPFFSRIYSAVIENFLVMYVELIFILKLNY